MGISTENSSLRLTHFPLWGILVWATVGVAFVPMGLSLMEESQLFGFGFVLCGAASLAGSFLLKKTSVVFDKDTNSIVRCWKAWIGVMEKTQSIRLDEVCSVIYECEQRTSRNEGVKQLFSLYCNTEGGGVFHLYPVTYTPRNASELGGKIAEFLGVEFKSLVSDAGKGFFKRQDEK